MKPIFTKITLVMILSMSIMAFAQLKTEGFAVGFGGGGVLGDGDIGRDDKIGPYGSAWLRHAFAGVLEGQLSGNALGELSRKDDNIYKTKIYSGDYRLLLRPLTGSVVSPYIYGGAGALYYQIDQMPTAANSTEKDNDWKIVAPVGGGLQLALSDYVSIDISGGYNFTNTDAINAIVGGTNDGYFNAAAGLTIKLSSGTLDRDGDGLSDKEEKRLGTNKDLADSDTDGLSDGAELSQYRTHPLRMDSDNDGLSDFQEIRTYLTDPRKRDTDGDDLSDSEEVFTYKTNPLEMDSDKDKLSDKDEIITHRTDPNRTDSDGDGLDDGLEITQYITDPLSKDSDNDGLTDQEEVNKIKTDPLNPDTDGDGLKDGEEVLIVKSDPRDGDTDGGGVGDYMEYQRGSNPADPDDDGVLNVKNVGDKIILDGILFASGSARINTQSEVILDKAYNTLVQDPEMMVEIRGYTDNVGSYNTNLRLSQRRADAVRLNLIQRGIAPERLSAKGLGPANPIASNSTANGKARNRRIEFVRTQ